MEVESGPSGHGTAWNPEGPWPHVERVLQRGLRVAWATSLKTGPRPQT